LIIKIKAYKIKLQPNIMIFIWDWNNLKKNKLKYIMKNNSKSIKYWMMKLEKKPKKDST